MELTTKRLVLQEYTTDDIELFHAFRNDPAINKYMNWNDLSIEESKKIFKEFFDDQKEVKRSFYSFKILLNTRPIGEVGMNLRGQGECGGIGVLGYYLLRPYWHKGYAYEAAQRVIQYGFEELGLHKIAAFANHKNKKSIKLMKRLGMKKEGKYKEEEYNQRKGIWEDMVGYGLLKREWEKEK